MTFYGPARDTVLTSRQTEKLNFDTNYITKQFNGVLKLKNTKRSNTFFLLQLINIHICHNFFKAYCEKYYYGERLSFKTQMKIEFLVPVY
jgi:hypothetical protein